MCVGGRPKSEVIVLISKFSIAAVAAASLLLVSLSEAKAQKGGIGLKVRDGITVRDTKKAKMEANYYLNEADKLREAGLLDQAVLKYQKAMQAYPNEPDAYKHLGGTYAKMGKLQDAETTLKTGTRIAPRDWLMWNNYAVVLLNLNKNEECKAAIKQALALNPSTDKAEELKTTLKQLEGKKQ